MISQKELKHKGLKMKQIRHCGKLTDTILQYTMQKSNRIVIVKSFWEFLKQQY